MKELPPVVPRAGGVPPIGVRIAKGVIEPFAFAVDGVKVDSIEMAGNGGRVASCVGLANAVAGTD